MPYTGAKLVRYYSWKNLRCRDRSNIAPEWGDFEKYLEDTGYPLEGRFMVRLDKKQPWGPENFSWKERTLSSIKEKGTLEYQKDWREKNPDYNREKYYKRKYGITVAQYEGMLKTQDHRCANTACRKHETQSQQGKPRRLAVDHNHKTKKVRELLCNNCNASLGYAKDSVHTLVGLIKYLDKHSGNPGEILALAIALLKGDQ